MCVHLTSSLLILLQSRSSNFSFSPKSFYLDLAFVVLRIFRTAFHRKCQGPERRRIALTAGARLQKSGMLRCLVNSGMSLCMTVYDRSLRNIDDLQHARKTTCEGKAPSMGVPSKHVRAIAIQCIGYHLIQHSWRRAHVWVSLPSCKHVFAPHGMGVSTELGCCSCVCTHQTEKRQVGTQQDLTVTCASCETCPFFGVVESVVEHMKKPLFEFSLDSAQVGSSGPKEDMSIRQIPPTTQRTAEGNAVHASAMKRMF